MAHSVQLVYACEDPARMTEFWAEALGYIAQPPPPGFDTWDDFADSVGIPEEARNDISAVVDPDGVGPRILFERWDGGTASRRFHIDINSVGETEDKEARLEEERSRLEAIGARFGRVATGMAGEVWMEMYDPEGNWFCVQ